MSPSSPDCLRLTLGQQGWRLEGRDHAQHARWDAPALDTLALPKGYRQLAVQLEPTLARCQLLRFPKSVRASAERQAFMQAVFRDVQGIDPANWQIVLEAALPGEPVFAAAIEHTTLAALHKLAQSHQMKLVSVQPAFSACWNALQNQMGVADGALVWLADGRASLGLWQAGSWLALRSVALASGDGAALGTLLQLLLASSGYSAEAGVLYLAGESANMQVGLPAGWTSNRLSRDGGGQ